MPFQIPVPLQAANWNKLKAKFPMPHNKETKITEQLEEVEEIAKSIDTKVVEGAVDLAKKAPNAAARNKIFTQVTSALAAIADVSAHVAIAGDIADRLVNSLGKAASELRDAAADFTEWAEDYCEGTQEKLDKAVEAIEAANLKLSIEQVLGTPALRQKLREFTKTEYSDENVEFLDSISKGVNQALYEKFVMQGADRMINLSYKCRRPLMHDAAQGIYNDVEKWKKAEAEIVAMLRRDTLARFRAWL